MPAFSFTDAAVIAIGAAACVTDFRSRRIPNVLTFGASAAAVVFWAVTAGLSGAGWSVAGWAVGCAVFMPWFLLGGMGAGDVKLLAGVGAWIWTTDTLYSYCWSAVFGGVIAVGMVLYRKAWNKHAAQFMHIVNEVVTIRDPNQLSAIAAERKPTMLLLPYGIPIAIGTIFYFVIQGMLL